MTDTKLDVIDHINELITAQPDGSPLTPKLHDVVAEIKELRDRARERIEGLAENQRLQIELDALRAEHEKLRELAGAVSGGASQREIKRESRQAED